MLLIRYVVRRSHAEYSREPLDCKDRSNTGHSLKDIALRLDKRHMTSAQTTKDTRTAFSLLLFPLQKDPDV